MIDLVAGNLERIHAACMQHGVSFLELVGSDARDDFAPSRSDIDVITVRGIRNPLLLDSRRRDAVRLHAA